MLAAGFWLGLAIIVGVGANTRGRNGPGWFLLALIISPLLAALLLLALPKKLERPEEERGSMMTLIAPLPDWERKKQEPETSVFEPDAILAGTPYRKTKLVTSRGMQP
jgi:hypothetical protein